MSYREIVEAAAASPSETGPEIVIVTDIAQAIHAIEELDAIEAHVEDDVFAETRLPTAIRFDAWLLEATRQRPFLLLCAGLAAGLLVGGSVGWAISRLRR